jgi:hypothetical protein
VLFWHVWKILGLSKLKNWRGITRIMNTSQQPICSTHRSLRLTVTGTANISPTESGRIYFLVLRRSGILLHAPANVNGVIFI